MDRDKPFTDTQDKPFLKDDDSIFRQSRKTRPFESTPDALSGGVEELEKSTGTTNGPIEIDECR